MKITLFLLLFFSSLTTYANQTFEDSNYTQIPLNLESRSSIRTLHTEATAAFDEIDCQSAYLKTKTFLFDGLDMNRVWYYYSISCIQPLNRKQSKLKIEFLTEARTENDVEILNSYFTSHQNQALGNVTMTYHWLESLVARYAINFGTKDKGDKEVTLYTLRSSDQFVFYQTYKTMGEYTTSFLRFSRQFQKANDNKAFLDLIEEMEPNSRNRLFSLLVGKNYGQAITEEILLLDNKKIFKKGTGFMSNRDCRLLTIPICG